MSQTQIMTKPRLSIGLPVYNGEKYLRRCLDSLLGQDFEDFELIISDNASTDGTEGICRLFAKENNRIRYYRSDKNQGATWNFQRVLDLAEGRYFKWAAHDDECHPTMFRRCVEVFEQADPSVALVYPLFEFIDETGAVVMRNVKPEWDRVETSARTPHQRLAHVIWRNYFGQAIYGVMRTDYLRQTTSYGRIAPDWIKLAELAMLGKILEVPEVLFRLRRHEANTAAQFKNWRDLLAWHDPSRKKRSPAVPYSVAIVLEYFKAVRHSPLPPLEKLFCGGLALTEFPLRCAYSKVLRASGPVRIRLREMTGWKWLSRISASSK